MGTVDRCSTSSHPGPASKRKAGRKKFKETRHPMYRGVRERNGGKWVCEVREPHKKSRLWLGTFATPDMAARAHDVAVIALRGDTAPLNFPDTSWALPRPRSVSPVDIRIAAVEAAVMFKNEKLAEPKPMIDAAEDAVMFQTEKPEEPKPRIAAAEAAVMFRTEKREEPNPKPKMVFVDEEEMFNLPELMDEMAAGMLVTPLAMQRGFDWNGVECDMDLYLWSV